MAWGCRMPTTIKKKYSQEPRVPLASLEPMPFCPKPPKVEWSVCLFGKAAPGMGCDDVFLAAPLSGTISKLNFIWIFPR